jgi:hypothetical protein
MSSASIGLARFIQYMGEALPVLLVILAITGIIITIGYSIAYIIKKYFK